MAVVFISPKKRQKVFFLGIAITLMLFLIFVSFAVFLAKPAEVPQTLVFNKPKVSIDIGIFDSDQFKGLKSYAQMQTQYTYRATTEDNKVKIGIISAESEEEAKATLSSMGLAIAEIKEVQTGRSNPFTPYYQSEAVPTTEAEE